MCENLSIFWFQNFYENLFILQMFLFYFWNNFKYV